MIIDENGFRLENKEGAVRVDGKGNKIVVKKNNQQINYKDDSDSININYRNNQNNR